MATRKSVIHNLLITPFATFSIQTSGYALLFSSSVVPCVGSPHGLPTLPVVNFNEQCQRTNERTNERAIFAQSRAKRPTRQRTTTFGDDNRTRSILTQGHPLFTLQFTLSMMSLLVQRSAENGIMYLQLRLLWFCNTPSAGLQ